MSRNNVTKRAMAAIAAVGAMSMMLAGCGSNGAGEQTKDGKPLVKVMFQNATNQDVKTMAWTKDLEKACGCTIEWSQVSDTQWAQQKSATLSAGNPADVTIRGYHPSDAQKYQFFEDLSDDLDKMPNVEKFFKEQPVAQGMVTTPDGKMYTLPRYQGKLYKASGQHLFINKTWLDKLGLQVPKTWDELFKVMDAFKTQDPNGNGQADEIPYAMRNLDMTGFGWWSPFLFLNSTGIATQFNNSPSRFGFYVKDGKVKNFMIEQEYRDVIDFLHEMIEKGYSPKDSLTQDSSKYYASLTGSSDGKTATVGLAITNTASAFGDLADEYEAIEWPASKSGVTAKADFSQDAGAFDDYGVAVSADAPNKDAIFKLINALYDGSTNSITQRYGTIGDWITKDSDTEYTINPKLWKLGANDKQPAFMDRFAGWIPDSVTIKGDTSAEQLKEADDVYADQLKAVGDDYFPVSIVPSDEDSTTLSNDNANIMGAALVQSAKWIQDGGLTDDAWNSYVEGLKGMNIEQDAQLWQKWLDEANKKD
ncbi:ABC transporter substrate-binding protein [Bifidobacterium ramosum]|uniref:ABC transporter substrate-binding protein n=1 Tax=Bifidobacterium ramosum TaxID=1798158 RepID=A0A6L4WYM6_9BIFI|nr:extracellular solute-binding protein [Bifidobacterium ramosum]KAB8287208.1 ABC transporter substrate-binding protein [Bifidobacterium ramosum]NEG71920.1 extracellular solute-binding protein [Bifidobacterium ramosum]